MSEFMDKWNWQCTKSPPPPPPLLYTFLVSAHMQSVFMLYQSVVLKFYLATGQ